jgi:HAD superfamily hydrolase (TIGR01458 family)
VGDPELPRPVLTPAAYLLDLDGTLYTDAGAVAGGPEAVARLRARGIPFRCVTNTTSRSRAKLVEHLSACGYAIAPEEVMTPVGAAVAECRRRGLERVLALVPEAALPDLADLSIVASAAAEAEAVIVGDLGERWTFGLLQQAFTMVLAGAPMIALSRDRYFLRAGRLTLDAGPFVAALEYAAGQQATIVGKPSAGFYRSALESLGPLPGPVAMVGDDLWSDVQGAQRMGLEGWLVRTGKFRAEKLRESGIVPDRVLGSVAEVGE